MKVKLIAHTPNAEEVVAAAAKLCYSSVGVEDLMDDLQEDYDKKVVKFLDTLASYGHESPIEHISFTFAVEGVSRSLTHQLVRHRIASYSQQSQRYVKLDQFEYIMPPAIANNPKAAEIFQLAMEKDQLAYDMLVKLLMDDHIDKMLRAVVSELKSDDTNVYDMDNLKLEAFPPEVRKKVKARAEKMAIEDARYVFPNACETKIMFTMNARSLLNFLKHRHCKRAQWEIRELASHVLTLVREVCPTLFKYAGARCQTGPCPEGKMCCGEPYPKIKK